jgi:hypothetical protein
MNPRSPPARPHIGIGFHLHSLNATTEWAEDDAWDSTSDSESPRHSTLTSSWNRPSASLSTTTPKKVSRASSNSSSSTLAFSYTHVHAPSSYPPRGEDSTSPEAPKNGWTIVRTSHSRQGSENRPGDKNERQDSQFDRYGGESADADVEGDMILGDLETETGTTDGNGSGGAPVPHFKAKHNIGSVRNDVDDIVTGHSFIRPFSCYFCLMRLGTFARSIEWNPESSSSQRPFSSPIILKGCKLQVQFW